LSTHLEKKVEKILQLLDKLTNELVKGTPIIVEGRNDIKALDELGLAGDIISAKSSGKSLLDLLGEVEKRGKREVILLMDFDRRGRELTSRLAKRLERMRIIPNLRFWKGLFSLVGHDVKDIEGLATYLKNLSRKTRGQISKV
jgi:2,5-diamino-6-(ribosylamino)-4(3H)-pyrimidinone 5'-phosphate reductase